MSSPAADPRPYGAVRSRVPRIAEAAVERARLTVVPRAQAVRAARLPFVVLISAIMLGGVIGLLMFNTSMQQTSFTATTLEGRATTLLAREQALTAELEELRDPQHLASAARAQGMRTPVAPAFLMPDGTVRGEAVPTPSEDGERITGKLPPMPALLAPEPPAPAAPADSGRDSAAQDAAPGESGDTGAGSRERERRDDRKNRNEQNRR
ncbi:hypothetical protein GHK92_11345 [Nocardioides sp. dk4132]|uniref:hypothetical protein n=1 Tax=unclassified Nocardioides TaxID=2615069 RepID=UPI001294BF98|nr:MULTISPECIES: hypothetical protein [unclassified Nocardioides]MQW76471.1 hypothetical protein [Nocardioides sp. dk4132]QGA07263.1 hypothetical protein GFH29_07590 [Nocardioides sp. dk884]